MSSSLSPSSSSKSSVNRYPRSSGRFGFTLVELLVVIGIIAVLIAILLPGLSKARESARRVKCAANLKQWHMAVMMYNNDQGCLPGPMYPITMAPEKLQDSSPGNYLLYHKSFGAGDQPSGQTMYYKTPAGYLWRYVGKSDGVFICPTSVEMYENAKPVNSAWIYGGTPGWRLGYAYLFNNQWDTDEPFFFGYAGTDPNQTVPTGTTPRPRVEVPKKLASVNAALSRQYFGGNGYGVQHRNHAQIWMMSDADSWNFYQQTGTAIQMLSMWGLDRDDRARESRRWKPAHGTGSGRGRNFVFFDGHVQFVNVNQNSGTVNDFPTNTLW